MALQTYPVAGSSFCKAIGYDDQTGEMHVVYHGGRTSIHGTEGYPVPQDIFDTIRGSVSVGKMVHALVKDQYPHRYKF